MSRIVRAGLVLSAILAVLVAGGAAVVYRASQQVPEFYEEAIAVEPEQQAEAGDQLEQQVLQLHNEVRTPGQWEAVFSNEQVNGWLAYDLPRKFAAALPPGVSDPRVAFEPDVIHVACRYDHKKISSIISLTLDVSLTDEPNVVAVRIRSAQAGALPLPLKQFLDQITKKASEADLTLRWQQQEGDPVALLTIPEQHEQYRFKSIFLEAIDLNEGEIRLAGRTESESHLQQASAVPNPIRR